MSVYWKLDSYKKSLFVEMQIHQVSQSYILDVKWYLLCYHSGSFLALVESLVTAAVTADSWQSEKTV